jgi:hypothetical protein
MLNPSTIRRQALEEVLAIIRTHPKREAMSYRIGLIEAGYVLQSLLAADPREADKGVDAMLDTPAKSYLDGVRDALAALPERVTSTWDGTQWLRRSDVVAAISALLPQPKDEAEEIVEAYRASLDSFDDRMNPFMAELPFARWLLSQGWRAPQ